MKKRIVSLVLAVGMVFGLTACGGGAGAAKDNPMVVTIGGNQYDLTGDFREVVGQMVKDGIVVYDSELNEDWSYWYYDENAQLTVSEESGQLLASEKPIYLYENTDLIVSRYDLSRKVPFETVDGITETSTKEELESVENYTQMGFAYYALYMDGKMVDPEAFRDTLEEYLDATEEKPMSEATEQFFPQGRCMNFADIRLYQQMTQNAYVGREFRNRIEQEQQPYTETVLLFMLATEEAYRLLTEGKIETYDIIIYGGGVFYEHYSYDPDWDESQFGER